MGALAAVGVLGLLTAGCSSDDDAWRAAAQEPTRGLDLTAAVDRTRPVVTASGDVVVAYGGVGSAREQTLVAVSTDRGSTFDRLHLTEQIDAPAVILGRGDEAASTAVLVGSSCDLVVFELEEGMGEAPEPECRAGSHHLIGRIVDLRTGATQDLPDPPISLGFVDGGIGREGDEAVVLVQRDDGPALLGWNVVERRWSVRDLPAGTTRVCAEPDGLVAVAPGKPDTSNLDPVEAGAVLFTAWRATEGGGWGEPIPYASPGRDLNFLASVSCGPTSVVAFTAHAAVLRPGADTWTPIPLPDMVAIQPGAAAAWQDDDRLVLWPPIAATSSSAPRTVEVTGILTGTPKVSSATDPVPAGTTAVNNQAPGTSAAGLVLVRGDTGFDLVRLDD